MQQLMQTKNQMELTLRNKEEHILSLQEAKQASEDRSARLEADLAKERDELQKLMSLFEAKKEEHLREERKVKNFEISDTKQKDMLKQKDLLIKMGEDKQKQSEEEIASLNEQINKLKVLVVGY